MSRLTRVALAAAAGIVAMGVGATSARATQTLSPDGRTATDGTRALGVSAVKDLNPDGEIVTVDGRGYNPNKGFYVAFCVQPAPGQKPGPCGGGDDRDGASGSSVWLSNELTSRAQGAQPVNADGSFHLRMVVKAVMDGLNIDCRKTKCAVVTRNDHTRGNDRSQDLVVPVTFRPTAATTTTPGPTTTLPPVKLPPSTTTTLAPELTAPVTVVDTSGRSVNGGGKTLSADVVRDLRTDQQIRVHGQGYDAAKGVYVSLCAIANAVSEPGPCGSGSAGASAWVTSHAPSYLQSRATPYAPGGAFDVTITVDPLIDADHDCRLIRCAIATRNDDTNRADRSQDLFLPVTFAAAETTTTTTATPATVAARVVTNDDESSTPYEVGFGAMVVIGLAWFGLARARRGTVA